MVMPELCNYLLNFYSFLLCSMVFRPKYFRVGIKVTESSNNVRMEEERPKKHCYIHLISIKLNNITMYQALLCNRERVFSKTAVFYL